MGKFGIAHLVVLMSMDGGSTHFERYPDKCVADSDREAHGQNPNYESNHKKLLSLFFVMAGYPMANGCPFDAQGVPGATVFCGYFRLGFESWSRLTH